MDHAGEKNPDYAFGFQIFHAGKPKVIGHTGGFPGISSVLWIDLDEGYTLAALANMDGGSMRDPGECQEAAEPREGVRGKPRWRVT